MKLTAIITPWWGKDLKGGAEQQAYQLATRLASRGHAVEILTTCCRSFSDDWAINHMRKGASKEDNLIIRHFSVDKRNSEAFDRVNIQLLNFDKFFLKLSVSPITISDTEIFVSENINSEQLLKFLQKNYQNYHAFIFIPYLYGIILNGLPKVAQKAFLQPCLHDEVYSYLPQVENIFHSAKGLLFISKGEADIANRLYGPGIIQKSIVAGAGVEDDSSLGIVKDVVKGYNIKNIPFILCLGRRDKTKNTDFLLKVFARFKQKVPQSNLHLVLAGVGDLACLDVSLEIPDLIDLGLVSEEEKNALLNHCTALFQPSKNESYSRVMMEAWLYQRPVAVNEECLATLIAVKESQGGYFAVTEEEWINLFFEVDNSSEQELLEIGRKGQLYAKENASWDNVMERYEKALGLSPKPDIVAIPSNVGNLKAIHQLLPNLSYGDAISNQAIEIRNYLRQLGYQSDIFVRYIDERLIKEAKIIVNEKPDKNAGLIYHHSIGCPEITQLAIDHISSKCLVYHNITPSSFFEKYNSQFAQLLEQGREDLKVLSSHFPISVADSAYNASELSDAGFRDSDTLPIIVNPQKWDFMADTKLMSELQDGKANLIFVGRIAPNKKQDDLIKAFAHYLTMDCEARLILVGYGDKNDAYYCYLIQLIEDLQLHNYVTITSSFKFKK